MTGILSSVPATRTVDTSVAMDKIPEWFPGARLNYAENLLRWAHLRRNDVELILPRLRFIENFMNVSRFQKYTPSRNVRTLAPPDRDCSGAGITMTPR